MRIWFVRIISTLLLFSAMALAQQEVIPVPLVDRTGAGSPLEITGKVLLHENARANELEWSWGEHISATNISRKRILLFVVTLTENGRYVPLPGKHSAPGNGPTYRLADDRFFSEKLIEPGESIILRDSAGTPNTACCINPIGVRHDASVEYSVQFVEFSDGSVFGDPTEGHGDLAVRQSILATLREIVQSSARGTSDSLAKLSERSEFSDTSVGRQVLSRFEADGTLAGVQEAKRLLEVAERRRAMTTDASNSLKVQ